MDRNGPWSRRRVLAATGTGIAATAGCVGSANDDGPPSVVASFFTFYDFARRIAMETPITVENLVPTGLHGHGWRPDPSITRDIIDANAFVHVGPDFQPWADRAIEIVHDDAVDTALIDVRTDVELLDLAASLDEDEQVGDGKDPHFWLDPMRAMRAVENIVEGFVTEFPDSADQFRSNADAIRADLASIDAEWRALVADAERDVVFLAAHNAFAYLADRYEVTIEPLVTNLAANDDVPPADRQRAQDTIAEHEIRHIGAAVFEPRRPARVLRDATDVLAYYPVTPYAGTTAAWIDRGWGYVDIARRINMETFRILLDAGEPSDGFRDEWENFA